MERMIRVALMAVVALALPQSAHAQLRVGFYGGYSRPFGACGYSSFRSPVISGFGHYGLHSAPHYGAHFGTHVGPYFNTFGFSNFGVHNGVHVDLHDGLHNDFHDVTGHTGTPYVVGPVYGYGSSLCPPPYFGGFSGYSVGYGSRFPYGGVIFGGTSNYSSGGMTQFYTPAAPAFSPPSRNGTSGYLPGLSYDRTAPRTPNGSTTKPEAARPVEAPGAGSASSRDAEAKLPDRIERENVLIEFLNSRKVIEVSWNGKPDEVTSVTFATKDASRVPLLLRRLTEPPFRARFDLASFIRYVSVDVEMKDGVTTTIQVPLP